nr:MAG TPA: hypothetical protein [Caudoviricetes sp.]
MITSYFIIYKLHKAKSLIYKLLKLYFYKTKYILFHIYVKYSH